MAACSPSELLASGAGFGGLLSDQRETVKLALLCRVLQNLDPMASCDVNALLEAGKAFAGLSYRQMQIVELQLLCDIEAAGVGGGGGSSIAATGDNYRFSGSGAATVLALQNLDSNLYNRIDSQGADGVQSVVLSDGAA